MVGTVRHVKVDLAMLCDAVTIRENLFHILGGGVTFVTRTDYPGPLNCQLALRVQMHRTEADRSHPIEVIVQGDDGQELAKVVGAFSPNQDVLATMEPGEELFTCIGIPLAQTPLPGPGHYSVEILIDGVHSKSVSFVARLR